MGRTMKKITIGAITVIIMAGVATYLAQPFGGGMMGGKVLTAAEKSNCGLTAEVTEGPYYVSGTSAVVDGNLNTTSLPGTPITISGHVYEGLDNSKPMANAKIEIWHTDASGAYHPANNGPVTGYSAEEIALRGFITTDAQGAYQFNTIYPGEYTGRTRHIHIKISVAGKTTLTTQLIIPSLSGDQLSFDEDTISKGLPTCHLLKFDTSTKPETARFDFRL
jgi:protocatechuate 3,4-dioxygenase beta subunit